MAVQALSKLEKYNSGGLNQLFGYVGGFLRRCLFSVLSAGPIPQHLAFIMDGNRRFAKKQKLDTGDGHKAGFLALMSLLNYCYELGVKYVTVYAFSIENFKRRPEEVQSLMDLMLEKIEDLLREESIVNQYGIRVYFIGNLKLLNDPVRAAAEKVMRATAANHKAVLLVCVAYTSCDEIVHAVQESCKVTYNKLQTDKAMNCVTYETQGEAMGISKINMTNSAIMPDAQKSCGQESHEIQISEDAITENLGSKDAEESEKLEDMRLVITLVDVERNMYMSVTPDPDIVIRSSGETRLSNFLLWQTSHCPLYSPAALWPEIEVWHLVWAILQYQRVHHYSEKVKKQQLRQL